jgi:hypothetical protein
MVGASVVYATEAVNKRILGGSDMLSAGAPRWSDTNAEISKG